MIFSYSGTMDYEGYVTSFYGAITVETVGKTYQLKDSDFFDPKKNAVVRYPESTHDMAAHTPNMFGGIPVDPFYLQPWSASLSPFNRGLVNARHGWVDRPPGN